MGSWSFLAYDACLDKEIPQEAVDILEDKFTTTILKYELLQSEYYGEFYHLNFHMREKYSMHLIPKLCLLLAPHVKRWNEDILGFIEAGTDEEYHEFGDDKHILVLNNQNNPKNIFLRLGQSVTDFLNLDKN